MKRFILVFVIVFAFYLAFNQQLTNHIKTTLLLIQTFSNFPIKPLDVFPTVESKKVVLQQDKESIVVDIYSPKIKHRKNPAIVLATGIRFWDEDKKNFQLLSQNLSKLGYFVLWPRSQSIEDQKPEIENPETFKAAVKYASGMDEVDSKRISIIGFSTGASIGLVAASNKEISEKIRAVVFFGGYYDIKEYIKSVSLKKIKHDGHEFDWETEKNLSYTIEDLLRSQNAENTLKAFLEGDFQKNINKNEEQMLKSINPKDNVKDFTTAIFIIHSKDDDSVPFVESIKLAENLDKELVKELLITNSFSHVKPKDLSLNIKETGKLYSFFYNTLTYL